VVWHDSLLVKLFKLGIPPEIWLLFKDWYVGLSAEVKWGASKSRSFSIRQGTGQGRTFSPTLYKVFNNDLLLDIEKTGLGAHIGNMCFTVPVCADDEAILAKHLSLDAQVAVSLTESYANTNRYTIGMKKTNVIVYPAPGKKPKGAQKCCDSGLTYAGEDLEVNQSAVHLGVIQSSQSTIKIQRANGNINKARKAAYALFNCGLHGRSGINPVISRKLWLSHILPTLIHGAEVWSLEGKDFDALEVFARRLLRQIQSLPPRTAVPVIYGLLGVMPIQGEVEKRALVLFRNIIALPNRREGELALRQLAMYGPEGRSWFSYIQRLLQKYDLPSAHTVLANPPTKVRWKKQVGHAVRIFWEDHLRQES
jgi:hypothetical protein